MRRQKAMGRSGGNRSTHQSAYDELLAKSIREADCNRELMKKRAEYPLNCLFHKSDRIPFFPDEIKDRAVTFYLFDLLAFMNGVR